MTLFLVVFEIHGATPQRLAEVVPDLQSLLSRLSTSPIELAFHSVNRDVFAYCIGSALNAAQVRAAIESPARDALTLTKPPLDGKDKITVLEVGADFAFRPAGTSRFEVWLQRHR